MKPDVADPVLRPETLSVCLKMPSPLPSVVSSRFVNSVFFLLPKLHGVLKTHCLECVLSRAEVIPDVYMLLQTKGFVQMMGHRLGHLNTNTAPAWLVSSPCFGVDYHSPRYVLLL